METGKSMFLRQVAIVAASNLSLQILGFVYRILLSRMAGAEGMGVYSLVMQIYTIAYSFCISGIFVAVNTIGAKLYAAGNHLMLRRLVRIAFLSLLALFFILAAPTAVMHQEIAQNVLKNRETDQAILLVLLCIFLTGVENIFKAVFLGARLVKHTSFSELVEQILRMIFVLLLLYFFADGGHGKTATLIVLGMTASELFSVSFLGINYCLRFTGKNAKPGRREPGLIHSFFDIAVPSVITALTCNVFSAVATLLFPARLVAAGFVHSQAVGVLGVLTGMAGPIFMLPAALTASVCTVLLPRISAATARGDHKGLHRELNRGMRLIGCIAIPFTALLVPFVPLICIRLFGQEVEARLVSFLAMQAAAAQYMAFTVCMQNGTGGHRKVLHYALLGEGLQLGLVYWLTGLPAWNVYGYLTGMIIGDVCRAALGMRHTFSRLRLRVDRWNCVFLPVAIGACLYAMANILLKLLTEAAAMSIGMALLLSIGVSMGVYCLMFCSLLRNSSKLYLL